MNCHEFSERFQQQLDARQHPQDDVVLVGHAQRCKDCRDRLVAWQRVSALLSPSAGTTARNRTSRPSRWIDSRSLQWGLAGSAAAIVFAAVSLHRDVPWSMTRSDRTTLASQSRSVENRSDVPESSVPATSPAEWWQQVDGRDWIRRTMPTVKLVQEGMAPLGRTLMRAATILTTGASEQTS